MKACVETTSMFCSREKVIALSNFVLFFHVFVILFKIYCGWTGLLLMLILAKSAPNLANILMVCKFGSAIFQTLMYCLILTIYNFRTTKYQIDKDNIGLW